jgi:menaquinone-dependent protoporphyrinogen oxidase
MNKILVAFATMAGSTMEIAETVSEEIAKSGAQVDVLPISEIENLEAYEGVVVGGPMIMGWHREALRFLKKHRKAFQKIPLAVFVMAMSLTEAGEMSLGGITVIVDDELPKPPVNEGQLNFRERYARLDKYLLPIIKATRPAKPVSIGVFGGRLEYGRLKWWAVLFAMLVIQAPAGDRRNWSAIRSWAAELPAALQVEERRVEG